jgi:membrane-associated PAP2 superfamily phosphatase
MVIETRARTTCRCSSRAVVSAVRGAGGAAARAAAWLDAVVIAAVSRCAMFSCNFNHIRFGGTIINVVRAAVRCGNEATGATA